MGRAARIPQGLSRRSEGFCLGPPVVPFYPFFGQGSPTKIDVLKKVGTLLLTSLLEDLVAFSVSTLETDAGCFWLSGCGAWSSAQVLGARLWPWIFFATYGWLIGVILLACYTYIYMCVCVSG